MASMTTLYKAGTSTVSERTRLLEQSVQPFDIEELKLRVAKLQPLKDPTILDGENAAGCMVSRSIGNSVVHAAVVLGAYFFIESAGRNLTPHCGMYHKPRLDWKDDRNWNEYYCFFSTFCFWTYPIICAFSVVLVFLKNLLDRRLFYECLLNRIFLVQHSSSHMTSPTVWLLFLYGICGLSCMWYVDSAFIDLSERRDEELVFGLLAYLSPTCGFIFVLCSQWSGSKGILPLPMFLERDSSAAIALLNECVFVDEVSFRRAFIVVEDELERACMARSGTTFRMSVTFTFELTTAELMRLVQDMHEKNKQPPSLWDSMSAFRPFKSYWVTRILYFPHLTDYRSARFRLWAWFHYVFTTAAALLFIYAIFYITNEFLVFQQTIGKVLYLPAPERPLNGMPNLVNATIDNIANKVRDVYKNHGPGHEMIMPSLVNATIDNIANKVRDVYKHHGPGHEMRERDS